MTEHEVEDVISSVLDIEGLGVNVRLGRDGIAITPSDRRDEEPAPPPRDERRPEEDEPPQF